VRDNDMNPAGISFTFFPPAQTYAHELSEYGSKFCHEWARNPRLQYPLLPLQNTVSFESAFPRRVLFNASARVMHYGYSGAGYLRVPDQRRLERPVFRDIFAGDLYLIIDLLNTPNVSLVVMVPDDRHLGAATCVPSFLFSCVLADATQRSAVARPVLFARVTELARTRRGSFAVSVVSPGSAETATVWDFEGVHCEPALCWFAVPASHTGVALVSANTVSAAESSRPSYPWGASSRSCAATPAPGTATFWPWWAPPCSAWICAAPARAQRSRLEPRAWTRPRASWTWALWGPTS